MAGPLAAVLPLIGRMAAGTAARGALASGARATASSAASGASRMGNFAQAAMSALPGQPAPDPDTAKPQPPQRVGGQFNG